MEDNQCESIKFSETDQDSELLLKFVDKFVKVQLIKNVSYTGFLHSFDPLSNSVILSVPHDSNFKTTLIPGHAITDMTIVASDSNIECPKRKPSTAMSIEEIIHKKKKVISWFRENLLPVVEAGHNIVIGNVTLLPPYGVLDVCTDSSVVALQIRSIIEKMPQDYEPK